MRRKQIGFLSNKSSAVPCGSAIRSFIGYCDDDELGWSNTLSVYDAASDYDCGSLSVSHGDVVGRNASIN
jgi:hypothetical protein